jgi:cytoskeletal protein CcmA (bactofilin family)
MFMKETRANGSDPIPMPQRPRQEAPAAHRGGTSIIGSDLMVNGNLSSDGAVQIDGRVQGDINSQTITVGESAEINGVLTAETITVSGTIEGKIVAQSVHLMSNARVTGDIVHQSISVEAGASIEGYLSRMDSERTVQALPVQPARTPEVALVPEGAPQGNGQTANV